MFKSCAADDLLLVNLNESTRCSPNQPFEITPEATSVDEFQVRSHAGNATVF